MGDAEDRGKSLPGRLASGVYPDLDHAIWRRRRRREIDADLASPAYADLIRRHPQLGRDGTVGVTRTAHVVVVPQEGEDFESFRPGTRNLYYEAAQNLRELIGAESVSVFSVHPREASAQWHGRLLDFLHDTRATHVITHIEHDPGTGGGSFTWDTFWTLASRRWDGILLGVMFDSAYSWIRAGSRHLGRISSRYMVVDICMPMDGAIVRGRPEVGPVNMPVSDQSMALVDARLARIEPEWDVSFIGVLYPYRLEMLERIRAEGITVATNPHRPDVTSDHESSRQNQPSWLDYMAGLRSSRMTINFSRSSAGPFEQLKTRVLEATLARTLLLTDDRDRTRLFWTPDEEFASFMGPEDLPSVIAALAADPPRLRRMAAAGETRARVIARTNFWFGINAGLVRRGLPPVLDPGRLR